MQKTVVVIVSHRGLAHETYESLAALNCPSKLILRGCPDQSKARSMAFDEALKSTTNTAIDTILALDDDMVFEVATIQALVDHSRLTQECCSAVAVGQAGQVCAKPLRQLVLIPGDPVRWLTGLACLAIPRARLEALRPKLPETGGIAEWCRSGAHPAYPGEWLGNDFWFCHHFGGVLLVPVPVGHMKVTAYWPDARTIREVDRYRPEA